MNHDGFFGWRKYFTISIFCIYVLIVPSHLQVVIWFTTQMWLNWFYFHNSSEVSTEHGQQAFLLSPVYLSTNCRDRVGFASPFTDHCCLGCQCASFSCFCCSALHHHQRDSESLGKKATSVQLTCFIFKLIRSPTCFRCNALVYHLSNAILNEKEMYALRLCLCLKSTSTSTFVFVQWRDV